jgi:HAMP domain-containing protein
MLQSFLHSLIESNALWLIWAAVGVLILGFCILFASVLLGESEEPLYRAASRRDDDSKMTV